MDARQLGAWGEDKAARYLRLHGYRIEGRNFRCRQGEIDIIALKRDMIVFAEVKLRKNSDFGEAREFVTYAKQQRLIAAAQLYMQQNDCEMQPRFDVIEIYAPNGEKGKTVINHIENAF